MNSATKPSKEVTMIVTTKNNQRTITKCLTSLLGQSQAVKKIIVVDNFSSDETPILVQKLHSAKIDFYQKGPERSAQRNFALQKVTTAFFMIVDSDQYLSPTVIENCLHAIEKKKVSMVAIPETNIEKLFAKPSIQYGAKAYYQKNEQRHSQIF